MKQPRRGRGHEEGQQSQGLCQSELHPGVLGDGQQHGQHRVGTAQHGGKGQLFEGIFAHKKTSIFCLENGHPVFRAERTRHEAALGRGVENSSGGILSQFLRKSKKNPPRNGRDGSKK